MNARVLLGASAAVMLLGGSAWAETLRLPDSGDPAFVLDTPDGWTHTVNGAGNLIVFNTAHSASINLKIGDLDGSLDELAVQAASTPDGMPPAKAGPVDVGSFHGTAYDSKLVNADGVHANVHMLLVKLDDDRFAAAILLTAENLKDDQVAAARAVLDGITLTTPASAPAPAPPPPPVPEAAPAPKP